MIIDMSFKIIIIKVIKKVKTPKGVMRLDREKSNTNDNIDM